ncbi:MAG: hypothetical protein ABIF92_01350 [archaeon]
MPEKSQMYEIVPVDPISKMQKKSESLENDIREIKSALRGTVGLSKLDANADKFIQRMLDLMSSSQKMVEEVAGSNEKVAQKLQVAIDHMNKINDELSEKLSQVLSFFAQATEAMTGEGEDESSDELVNAVNGLKSAMDGISQSNQQTQKILISIERNLKQQAVSGRRPMPPAPQMQLTPPPAPPGSYPQQEEEPPIPIEMPGAPPAPGKRGAPQGEPELPPPPFPP